MCACVGMNCCWMKAATSSLPYDSASSRTHPPQAGAAVKSARTGFLLLVDSRSASSMSFHLIAITTSLCELPSADERHLGGHHREELHVHVERKARHIDNRVDDVRDIHERLDGDLAVCLHHTGCEPGGQRRGGIANVDLAAGDIELPSIERGRLRQAGNRMLRRRVRSGIGARRMCGG